MTIFQGERRSLLSLVREFRASRAGVWGRYEWALGAAVASVALSLCTNLLASRALGPAGFGQFSVGVATLTLLGTGMGLGMPVTMVRYWGRLSEATAEARERSRLQAWVLTLVGTALVGASFLILQTLAPDVLARWVHPGAALILVVGGVGVALTQMVTAEAQMRLNFGGYFLTITLAGGLRFLGLAIVVLALGKRDALEALLGFGLGSFLSGSALTWGALHRVGKWLSSQLEGMRSSFGELVSFGLPILGSTLVVAAIEYVDILVLAALLPLERVGLYSAGARLLVIQFMVLAAVTTVALPLAARAAATGRQAEFLRYTFSIGAPLGLIVTTVLVASSSVVVGVVYGPAYAESALVFAVLSVGVLPNFVGNAASQMIYAAGAPGFLFVVHISQLAALSLGLPFISLRWGIMGVAAFRSLVNCAAVGIIVARVFALSRGRARVTQIGA